jgi:hypothetical protein
MRLRHTEEAIMHGHVQRKIQIGGIDGATQGGRETAGPERQQGFKIGKEEAFREVVFSAAELAVPVGGELINGVLAGMADG